MSAEEQAHVVRELENALAYARSGHKHLMLQSAGRAVSFAGTWEA